MSCKKLLWRNHNFCHDILAETNPHFENSTKPVNVPFPWLHQGSPKPHENNRDVTFRFQPYLIFPSIFAKESLYKGDIRWYFCPELIFNQYFIIRISENVHGITTKLIINNVILGCPFNAQQSFTKFYVNLFNFRCFMEPPNFITVA